MTLLVDRRWVSTGRLNALEEICAEADRGDAKHGPFNYPNGTRNGGMRLHLREMAQNSCERAVREGTVTAAKVLEEEVAEALAEEDPERLRAELIQIAAVALKWVEKIDREVAF